MNFRFSRRFVRAANMCALTLGTSSIYSKGTKTEYKFSPYLLAKIAPKSSAN